MSMMFKEVDKDLGFDSMAFSLKWTRLLLLESGFRYRAASSTKTHAHSVAFDHLTA